MTICLLSDVATIESGAGFPTVHQGRQGEIFPFLKVSDMNLSGNERLIQSWNNSVAEPVRSKLRAKAFPAGALIFPKIGAAIATNKKRQLTRPSCVDNNVMAVIPNADRLDSDFLYFMFLAKNLSDFASESNPPSIRKTDVEQWGVNIPPLPEQRRIVDLLSRAEGIVRLRREAEKKAAELIPALFLDMFGNPATNPKGWRTCSLDTVLSETKLGLVRGAKEMDGQNPFPYVRMDAVGGGSVRVSALKRVDATEKEIGEYSLRYGDFLFNTRNSKELVGKTGMFKGGNESVYLFNNNLMRMRFDGTSLLPEYVNALFQTSYIQKQLEAIKRGTTSVFAIYYKDLRHIELRLPDLKLQQEFAERFVQIDSIKVQQSAATAKAQTAFDALLAQTFT